MKSDLGVATEEYEESGYTKVKYHDTVVVAFNSEEIFLDSGGWRTVTTKKRINQVADKYNLGIGIIQRKGDWYVVFSGTELRLEFHDGIRLKR